MCCQYHLYIFPFVLICIVENTYHPDFVKDLNLTVKRPGMAGRRHAVRHGICAVGRNVLISFDGVGLEFSILIHEPDTHRNNVTIPCVLAYNIY